MTTDAILRQLASDTVEPSESLFAAAARDAAVVARLAELCERAAAKPKSLGKAEVNQVSWAAYVFCENGDAGLLKPLLALGGLDEKSVTPLLGAYADFDWPVILLRLAGPAVASIPDSLTQTYRGAPGVRIAPILAAGAAWAHGLIDRDTALRPLREELLRMSDDGYADAQDDEWLDTLLDAALELHPAGVEDELDALNEYWGLETDWEDELAEALAEPERDAKQRLRDSFPRLTRAMQFVERWEEIDADEA